MWFHKIFVLKMDDKIKKVLDILDDLYETLSDCNNGDLMFDIMKIELLAVKEKLKRYYKYYNSL